MPFQQGKATEGAGRKGYEFEYQQLEKMRELLNKDLKLLDKLYAGKIKEKDLSKLQIAQARMLKILDKLHASKQSIGGDEEHPLRVVILPKEVAQSFEINAINPTTIRGDSQQSEV